MSKFRIAARSDRQPASASVVSIALGAGLLAAGALSASAQTADSPQAPASTRAQLAELPRLPDGPVCAKDRDWMLVEAEQFIARTTARAEDLSKKVIELELAVDRDPSAARGAETTREELRETLRRVRDAQGYREDARRLTTRDCLVREGQGLDVRQAAPSVSGAATAQAPANAEPAIDVKLAQTGSCAKDTDCEIRLISETRRPATDDRRVAVLIDLPSAAGTFVRSGDTWKCYAMVGGAVCLAKLSELKAGAPVESRLTWRIQGAGTGDEAKFCTRTMRQTADGRPTTDPDRVRVLQAVLADYGYRTGAIDGRFADGTRVVLASAAPDFGVERNGDDDRIAAALLGSMVSRVGVSTGPCLQLALASTTSAVTSDAAPSAATAGAAAAAAAATAATAGRSLEPVKQPETKRPATKSQSASVTPEPEKSTSELRKAKVPVTKAATTTRERPATTRTRPATPVARAVPVEDEPAVVVRPKKRTVVVEEEPAGVVVKQPKVFVPPISIGIGLGRRGGIGFGF
ncbi:peptidoglycan-binding domain-containing protein [Prosthecomicrobium sp. N25]|uniref:peptidoglycan-binding domain-containing protein n=1 Tax=Prosthecomicrobium sp. N25 TaxID=3129254 RepID=UPI003076A6E8